MLNANYNYLLILPSMTKIVGEYKGQAFLPRAKTLPLQGKNLLISNKIN